MHCLNPSTQEFQNSGSRCICVGHTSGMHHVSKLYLFKTIQGIEMNKEYLFESHSEFVLCLLWIEAEVYKLP